MTEEILTEGMDAKEIAKLMKKAGCTDKQIQAVTGLTPSGLKAVLNEKIAFEDLESFLENWRYSNPSSLRSQAAAAMRRRGTDSITIRKSSAPAPAKDNSAAVKMVVDYMKKRYGYDFPTKSANLAYGPINSELEKDLLANNKLDGWMPVKSSKPREKVFVKGTRVPPVEAKMTIVKGVGNSNTMLYAESA